MRVLSSSIYLSSLVQFSASVSIMYNFAVQVPWLLLVNVLVMFILMVILYHVTILLASDEGNPEAELQRRDKLGSMCVPQQHSKGKVDKIRVIEDNPRCSTGEEVNAVHQVESFSTRNKTRTDIKPIQGGDNFSTGNPTPTTESSYTYNPCHLLQLVGKVFLSCLGLHSTQHDSSHDPNPDAN